MTFPDSITFLGKTYVPKSDGTLPPGMFFVRVLHELELAPDQDTTPPGRPEVRQLYPENLFVPFGKAWQLFTWKLNPLLSAVNMTQVYDDHLWIANNNGFSSASDPRANFFTGEDLTSQLPKVESLTCGGNILRVLGEVTIKRGGVPIPSYIIEVLDYRDTPPTVEWLKARPWLMTWAVNMGRDGTPRRFEQGSQPNGFIPGVIHPLLSDRTKVITIPKWRVVRWTEPDAPDPYRIYLPR